jgi:hypothetical protein
MRVFQQRSRNTKAQREAFETINSKGVVVVVVCGVRGIINHLCFDPRGTVNHASISGTQKLVDKKEREKRFWT